MDLEILGPLRICCEVGIKDFFDLVFFAVESWWIAKKEEDVFGILHDLDEYLTVRHETSLSVAAEEATALL